ncbi:MAG: tRNA dimethylallyltransferase [Gemmatimonadetes bacterium]|nr:tRNA dimethylallyltransferase [Gemmatimonadota bacterium]
MSSSAASAGADVLVLCGPTAAGKSAVAMALAARVPVTIISADSRQVYRGFDIGTAKPSASERATVPHVGIDVVEPTVRYNAVQWADAADRWIDEARVAGRVPVIVGGTGFYLRALFEPLFEEPVLDPADRDAIERELAPLALGELRERCAALDPARAHLGRAQLIRAIMVARLSGRPLSEWHRHAARPARRAARYLVVDPGEALGERIARRVDAFFEAGWLDEVAALRHAVPAGAPAWNSSGYGVMLELVEGRVSEREARERVVIETRQYAKRQRTWFRHQLPDDRTTRLDPLAAGADARAGRWLNEGGEGT